MLRKLRYGALLPILASMALLANSAPSGAAARLDAVGAGIVTGTVRFLPGVPHPGSPCIATTFVFTGTVAGVHVSLDSGAAAGTYNVTATGGSPCETTQSSGGTASITSISAGLSVTGSVLLCKEDALLVGGGFFSPLKGTYVRVGVVVILSYAGDLNINRSAEEDCEEVSITVVKIIVPAPLQIILPSPSGVTSGTVAGVVTTVSLGDSADGDAGDPT